MNLNEHSRVTVPPLFDPIEPDQKRVNRKILETFQLLFRMDGDKEERLRRINTDRGISRNTVDQLINGTLPVYANNATAVAGGLVPGNRYRTGADPDVVCVVH